MNMDKMPSTKGFSLIKMPGVYSYIKKGALKKSSRGCKLTKKQNKQKTHTQLASSSLLIYTRRITKNEQKTPMHTALRTYSELLM